MSSTYRRNASAFSIKYGSGALSGFVSNDNFDIGNLKIRHQDFAEATNEPFEWLSIVPDGIFGLGYDTISVNHITPPFYNMINQKLLDKPIFSFYLTMSNRGSEVIFGGTNKNHYTGKIQYLPIRRKGFWEVEISSVTIHNDSMGMVTGAVFDTGTSFIATPRAIADSLNQKIGAIEYQGVYTVDCAKISTYPDVTFSLAGFNFSLSARDYIFETPTPSGNASACVSSFIGLDSPLFILGSPFLRAYYSVYDLGENAVGLAPAK
ncbi:aspartic proteinase precursor [Conoideocrella luteorostrata]|uniref:Aspartic proteinase n=1 Tax=Conoideocrella luteorostrata TaxID=1105319 RepID=A0AAJ0CS06_9HYPO|nr:aspartic proteinase precursor [Conoideocrella luteorostrata]